MTERKALLAIHLGALLFGLSGIFGKLANTLPMAIVGGRAIFAVVALALFARLLNQPIANVPARGSWPCWHSAACCSAAIG